MFQTMKGDDGQPTADFKGRECRLQALRQLRQLVVDVDSHRLEDPCVGLYGGSTGRRRHGVRHHCRQFSSGGQWPIAQHGTSDAPCVMFFPVAPNDIGDFRFGRGVEPHRRGLAFALVHPHIQRAIGGEAESAPSVVELRRRDADIEHRAAQFTDAERIEVFAQVAEATAPEVKPRVLGGKFGGTGGRFGIAVHGHQ